MLALGPESAGASPGPACYGNDGPATLSDIALLAGRLIPDRFLGGEMNLDRNRSIQAIEKVISNRMAIDEMLDGVIELALVNLMALSSLPL
jgi:N-methylhydantoinase A